MGGAFRPEWAEGQLLEASGERFHGSFNTGRALLRQRFEFPWLLSSTSGDPYNHVSGSGCSDREEGLAPAPDLYREFREALAAIEVDPGVRAAVIRGVGRGF